MNKYQKEVYHIGVNVFNKLPTYMKIEFDNPKKFKLVLHRCLYELSLYHLDEYSEYFLTALIVEHIQTIILNHIYIFRLVHLI
jgi:hypothetical protein